MSNELEWELQLYSKFKCNQQCHEAQQLSKLKKTSHTSWDTMTKKLGVKSYYVIVVEGKEIWSEAVVKAIFCLCTQEVKSVQKVKDGFKYSLVSVALLVR